MRGFASYRQRVLGKSDDHQSGIRILTTCNGADAVNIPNFFIYKEVIENSPTDKRVENIDFLIQMDKPVKI
jgi:hypothetical protein